MELGRWATPFRRRVGRWLTDVTPLIGLLGDGGRWVAKRFMGRQPPRLSKVTQARVVPVEA